MNVLLDTHFVVWTLQGNDKLPEKAKEIIMDSQNKIYYSAVSTWEILLKHNRRPNEFAVTVSQFIDFCRQAEFIPLRLQDQHIAAVETLIYSENAPEHKDPFDKLLLAQAKYENVYFLTHDQKIPFYNEPCVICI